jgi:predicted ABC-type ATPase
MIEKTLILIRGVQGSGKTTLANLIAEGLEPRGLYPEPTSAKFEADHFFINPETGEYNWDGAKIGEAHRWCQHQTNEAMKRQVPFIIVSNTFVRRAEMDVYLEMAKQHGYETQEIICKGKFENVHGVDEEKVEKNRRKFEF